MPPDTLKHPTQWLSSNGRGYIQTPGTAFFVDNSGNFLVDNSGNFLVTTPSYVQNPIPTAWTPTVAS